LLTPSLHSLFVDGREVVFAYLGQIELLFLPDRRRGNGQNVATDQYSTANASYTHGAVHQSHGSQIVLLPMATPDSSTASNG